MTATPWEDASLIRGSKGILFGFGYDDERVELETLPRGRVLVIAAAGEIAAALAAVGDDVVAIDINPAQVDYAKSRVHGGQSVTGSAEVMMNIGRTMLRTIQPVWRKKRVARLLSLSPERGAEVWRRHFATAPLRAIANAVLAKNGAIGALVPANLRAGIPHRLAQRLFESIECRLGDPHNRFLYRLLVGEELPGWRMPEAPEDSITWLVGDVLEHLESVPAGTYDGISLSNVGDAVSVEWLTQLRRAAERALAPGGVALLRALDNQGADEDRDLATRDRCGLWGSIHQWRAPGRIDEASRLIAAAPAAVWEQLTNAALLAEWLPPRDMVATVHAYEASEGGAIEIDLHYDSGEAGKSADGLDEVRGTVGPVSPERVLTWQITFASDDPACDGTMQMRWSLTPIEQGTLVRVVATGVPSGIHPADHAKGLRQSLSNLARKSEA